MDKTPRKLTDEEKKAEHRAEMEWYRNTIRWTMIVAVIAIPTAFIFADGTATTWTEAAANVKRDLLVLIKWSGMAYAAGIAGLVGWSAWHRFNR